MNDLPTEILEVNKIATLNSVFAGKRSSCRVLLESKAHDAYEWEFYRSCRRPEKNILHPLRSLPQCNRPWRSPRLPTHPHLFEAIKP